MSSAERSLLGTILILAILCVYVDQEITTQVLTFLLKIVIATAQLSITQVGIGLYIFDLLTDAVVVVIYVTTIISSWGTCKSNIFNTRANAKVINFT